MVNKKRWYSKLFLLSVAMLLVSIPLNMFIKNWVTLSIISIILKVISLTFILIYSKKEKFEYVDIDKPKKLDLLLLPFLIITFSNLFVVILNKNIINNTINYLYLIISLTSCILTSIIEEIIFRHFIYKEFRHSKPMFKSILFTSLIFGGMHLLNINSIASIPYCLIQAVYTFGIGLILSIIYIFSKNIIFSIIVHFLFNFINDTLVSHLFNIEWNFIFFIVNITISVLIGLYALYIYKRYLVEEVSEYVS